MEARKKSVVEEDEVRPDSSKTANVGAESSSNADHGRGYTICLQWLFRIVAATQ